MATVKDPICGMEIDPTSAAGTSEYEGVTYYFCSVGCKQSFDADPAKHVGGALTAPVAAEPSAREPAAAGPATRKWWQFWKG